MYIYPEHDARLAGVRRLVYASASDRLIATCEDSQRIVVLDASEFDTLPIAGATEPLAAPPRAVAVDDSYIYALVGESLVKFTNAVPPVEVASLVRSDDNNEWLDLVGSDFLICADGVDVIIVRRSNLTVVSRVTSLVGRVRIGVYDENAGPSAYAFGDRVGCIVFVVSSSGGTLMAVEEATLPKSEGITGIAIDTYGGELVLANNTDRVSFWYFNTPTDAPEFECESDVGHPVKNISYVPDSEFYDFVFSTTERMEHSSARFDLTPETFALYAAGRCFRAYADGRVSSDTTFQVVRVTFGDTTTTSSTADITPSIPPVPEAQPADNPGFAAVRTYANMRLATRPNAGDDITIVFVPQAGMTFPTDGNDGTMIFDYDNFNTTQYMAIQFNTVGVKTVEFYAQSGWTGERTYGSLTLTLALTTPPQLTAITGTDTPTVDVSSDYSATGTNYNTPENVLFAWSQVSGPGTAVFTPPLVATPANPFVCTAGVVFPIAGDYVIQLTMTQADGQSITVTKNVTAS